MAGGMQQGMQTRQDMRQTMALTPQMLQSMDMLTLPVMDLDQRINAEVARNPALELSDMQDEARRQQEDERLRDGDPANLDDYHWEYRQGDPSGLSRRGSGGGDDDERFDPLSVIPARAPSLDESLRQQLGELRLDYRLRALCEQIIDSLDERGYFTAPLSAIGTADLPPWSQDLPADQRPRAAAADLTPPANDEERRWALDVVKSLRPAGVGAADLAECLALQLVGRDFPPEQAAAADAARRIVAHGLDDLAANKLPKIAADLGVTLDTVKQAQELIRSLDPLPGRNYAASAGAAVRPDAKVLLEKAAPGDYDKAVAAANAARERMKQAEAAFAAGRIEEDELRKARNAYHDAHTQVGLYDDDGRSRWVVELANGVRLDISETFLALFDHTAKGGKALRERWQRDPERRRQLEDMRKAVQNMAPGDKANSQQQLQFAKSFCWALEQRYITLTRVTKEVVAAQKDYLAERIGAPVPLLMKDLAEHLDIDNSTVSRAANGKFIDTPRGLIPLRDLFTQPLTVPTVGNNIARRAAASSVAAPGANANPADLTNVAIKNRIRELIENEDRKKPLKDHVIQDLLAKEGIKIARRTVVKYRESMGFGNYSQRREY